MSKNKQMLEAVVEEIKGMRYVSKLLDAIESCINTTVEEMAFDKDIACNDKTMIMLALEEIVLGRHYSGKDIEQALADAENEEEVEDNE